MDSGTHISSSKKKEDKTPIFRVCFLLLLLLMLSGETGSATE